MKSKLIIAGVLIATLVAMAGTGCSTDASSQAELSARAKISEAQAQPIALAQVPGGTVKESDLEQEKGRLIWSFDIVSSQSSDITEVAVDAVNGRVVSVAQETPAQQAGEKD